LLEEWATLTEAILKKRETTNSLRTVRPQPSLNRILRDRGIPSLSGMTMTWPNQPLLTLAVTNWADWTHKFRMWFSNCRWPSLSKCRLREECLQTF
jgi:hypothetical protein